MFPVEDGTLVEFDSREKQTERRLDPVYDPPDPFLLSLHASLCHAIHLCAAGEKSDDIWDDDFTPLLYDDRYLREQDCDDEVMEWIGGLPEDSIYHDPNKQVQDPPELSSLGDDVPEWIGGLPEVNQNIVARDKLALQRKAHVSPSNFVDLIQVWKPAFHWTNVSC